MISYYLLTSQGDRNNNEDNVGMYQSYDEYCFVLADGLGGHGKGEVASDLAVEQSVMTFALKGTASEECICQSFQNAQNKIHELQNKNPIYKDMKTTLVILHVGKEEIRWGHVGDSRLYYFERGKLVGRTLDHSVPQMLVEAGEIKEKKIRHHPDRNRLLRVMGIEGEEPRYQLGQPVDRKPGQAFLLCTDGFWELIDEKKMASCLKKARNPQNWLELMEQIVKKHGQGLNMDNYSAVGVWID